MTDGELRYRDTARFLVPESRRQEVTRGYFQTEIMDGILKMGVEEVLCLQHHPRNGIFEVTFNSVRIFDDARRTLIERALAPALRGIRWELSPLFFTVVVHVFNPHVREEDILIFLRRHAVAVKDGTKMKDECGYWNGRRRYRLQPRVKADGSGLAFPPRVFSLGPDKGVLFIPEVPASATCWTCGKIGHEGKDCAMKRCRNCEMVGHVAKDCTKPKLCSLCGKGGHLFKSCQLRALSYAAVAEGKEAGKAQVPPAEEPKNQPGKQKGEGKGEKQKEGEKGAGKALVPPTKEPTSQPEKQKGEEKGAVKRGMAAAASTLVATPHGGQDGRPNISLRKAESGAGAAAAPGKRTASGGEESEARRMRTGTGAVRSREVVEEKEMRSSEESDEEEEDAGEEEEEAGEEEEEAGEEEEEAGKEKKVPKPRVKEAIIRRLVGEKASDAEICAAVGASVSGFIKFREKKGISEGEWDWLRVWEDEDGAMCYGK